MQHVQQKQRLLLYSSAQIFVMEQSEISCCELIVKSKTIFYLVFFGVPHVATYIFLSFSSRMNQVRELIMAWH